MWTYQQANGFLDKDGILVSKNCYSGIGFGLNNPEAEADADLGPIPQGLWIISGPPFTSLEHTRANLPVWRYPIAGHFWNSTNGGNMKFIRLSLFVLLTAACSFAQPVRNHALATHHTIKASGRGFKKLGKELVAIPKDTVVGAYSALEASVDAFGVAVQGFADAVDMGIAAPLEALPKPLNEIGVGVHYVYEGVDWVGTQLAK